MKKEPDRKKQPYTDNRGYHVTQIVADTLPQRRAQIRTGIKVEDASGNALFIVPHDDSKGSER